MNKLQNILVLLAFGLFFFPSCDLIDNGDDTDDGDVAISDCNVKRVVENNYGDDATRLALRSQLASPAKDDILVSSNLINRYLAALSAIHSSDFAARDSVFDVYEIHTTDFPEFNELTLQVDISKDWVQEWEDGNVLTGNSDVDGLVNFYGLKLNGFNSFDTDQGTFHLAELVSNDPLNIAALADRFKAIDGVFGASTDSESDIGNEIVIVDNGTSLEVTFTVGYDEIGEPNDCDGDCDFARSWIFEVADNCEVRFINAIGDSAP